MAIRKHNKNNVKYSFIHKLIPILIMTYSLFYYTQKYAKLCLYKTEIVGNPFYINGKAYYSPFKFLTSLITNLTIPERRNYLYISTYCMKPVLIWWAISICIYIFLSLVFTVIFEDKNTFGTAKWGDKKTLKKAGLAEKHGGVILGQQYSAWVLVLRPKGKLKLVVLKRAPLVQFDNNVSAILIAPSRTGKGISSVITTILSFPYSIIILDPKGENWKITAGYRSKFSYVLKLAPCDADDNTLHFNILNEIDDKHWYRDANMIADILTSPEDGKKGEQAHWIDTARGLITGAILHVMCSDYPDKTLPGVSDFLASGNNPNAEVDVRDILNQMKAGPHSNPAVHDTIVKIANDNLKRPDDELGSVFSTASTALEMFNDTHVRKISSSSDFCLDDFKFSEIPLSLYLTVPFPELKRISSYLRLIITFILNKFSQDGTKFGDEPLKNRILFLIDEFCSLGNINVIETMMSILNGYFISFYLIVQSKSQIDKLYGRDSSIWDHCAYTEIYANTDVESAEYFSKMAGIKGIKKSSSSDSGSKLDSGLKNTSISTDVTQTNLINADEILHYPANSAIVFPQGFEPVQIKKIAYYSDSRFKHKANLPYPDTREELLTQVVNSIKPSPDKVRWYTFDKNVSSNSKIDKKEDDVNEYLEEDPENGQEVNFKAEDLVSSAQKLQEEKRKNEEKIRNNALTSCDLALL